MEKSKTPKESKLTAEFDGIKKKMVIDLEKTQKITIEREGEQIKVTGHEYGPTEKLVIDGQEIPNVFPDDTVIFTHHSPACGYYYFNRRWWYR
jgi:hypothetical protein